MKRDGLTKLAIWFLAFSSTLILRSAAADRFAVYRSEDDGRTWNKSDAGLADDKRINAFVATTQTVVAATDGGILVSSDKGFSWKAARILDSEVGRVVCVAAIGELVWAGTDKGFLLTSFDAGKTWERNGTYPRSRIRSLHVVGSDLYVGTNSEQVYRSMDRGKTWIHLSAGLPAEAQVFALASVDGRVFAGLYSKGLFVWNDVENRWLRVGALQEIRPLALASSRKTLLAGHNAGGIYASEDFGQSWKHWSLTDVLNFDNKSTQAPIWEMAADEKLAIAGAGDGILISRDRGASWTRATTGLPTRSPGIAFVIHDDFILAAIHEEK